MPHGFIDIFIRMASSCEYLADAVEDRNRNGTVKH